MYLVEKVGGEEDEARQQVDRCVRRPRVQPLRGRPEAGHDAAHDALRVHGLLATDQDVLRALLRRQGQHGNKRGRPALEAEVECRYAREVGQSVIPGPFVIATGTSRRSIWSAICL